MQIFKKVYFLIYPILSVVFILLLRDFTSINDDVLEVVIGVSLAYVLSPKVKIVEKQHGQEEQIKWLFFKKVVNSKI